jgi:hypothetical protein
MCFTDGSTLRGSGCGERLVSTSVMECWNSIVRLLSSFDVVFIVIFVMSPKNSNLSFSSGIEFMLIPHMRLSSMSSSISYSPPSSSVSLAQKKRYRSQYV